MQKVKTNEYEFLARLLSPVPLYEFRWKESVFVTPMKNLRDWFASYCPNLSTKELTMKFDVVSSHTARGAWKKVCKNLNK